MYREIYCRSLSLESESRKGLERVLTEVSHGWRGYDEQGSQPTVSLNLLSHAGILAVAGAGTVTVKIELS